jgi:hypothetical protein
MSIDPKLIKVSPCGKYVYPVDVVTGSKTFALIPYFERMLGEKYGGDLKKFVNTYMTRETKKYLADGWSIEDIKAQAAAHKGKLPKLHPKIAKHPDMPKKERRKRLASHAEETIKVVKADGTEEVVRKYPWSSDPEYFKSTGPTAINMSEATKDACFRPDIYLNEQCHGCQYYDVCQLSLKYPVRR